MIMKKINQLLIIGLVFLTAVSCKKDFLDVLPKDKYSDETVWNDPALIQSFVNNF